MSIFTIVTAAPLRPPLPTVALLWLIVEVHPFPFVTSQGEVGPDSTPCRCQYHYFCNREVDCKSHTFQFSGIGSSVPSYQYTPPATIPIIANPISPFLPTYRFSPPPKYTCNLGIFGAKKQSLSTSTRENDSQSTVYCCVIVFKCSRVPLGKIGPIRPILR